MIMPTRRVIAPAPTPGRPRGAGFWWAITAGMFALGLGLLLLGAASQAPSDAVLSSMGTAAAVAGLFLWIGGLVTALLALVAFIRTHRSRARTPTGAL